jgi:hypothetical protein
VGSSDLVWEEVKDWFDFESNEFLPEGFIPGTAIEDWQAVISLAGQRGWDLEYFEADEMWPMPKLAEMFTQRRAKLEMWPTDEILVIFWPLSPREVHFDIDLRAVTSQETLDQLCDLVRSMGEVTGKQVKLSPEGMNSSTPFMGYEPELGRVVMLSDTPRLPRHLRSPAHFTVVDNWYGGFYELAIEIGPAGDDEALQRALAAVWSSAEVTGCYPGKDLEPADQEPVPCTVESLVEYGHLRGQVRLADGTLVVCGAVTVREEDGSDWLDFYLPLGALERADSRVGAFPFDEPETDTLLWREPLDTWLAGIARGVFEQVRYRLALIGWEVSGDTRLSDLDGDPVSPRGIGYLLPGEDGELRYLPAEQ